MIRFYSVLIVMVFSLSLSGCAYRQIMVPEVVDSEFAAAYRNDLKTLASDEFQGRKPGTPGGKMTQEYLISSFKSIGLEPGNNGSYLQEVKLLLEMKKYQWLFFSYQKYTKFELGCPLVNKYFRKILQTGFEKCYSLWEISWIFFINNFWFSNKRNDWIY